jgi:hypothetical protein
MKVAEPRTYRATTEAWLGQLLLPMCFFVLLTITAINAAGLDPSVALVGLAILIMLAAFDYIAPMLRNWIAMDGTSIEGSLNGRYFQVYWTETKAAWLHENRRRRYLCLGTRDGTMVIPLRFFEENEVWNHVRALAPVEALEENALLRLPDYQDWLSTRERVLDDPGPRQIPDHWLLQIVGWSGVSFFLFGVIEALQENNLILAVVQLGLVGISLVLLSSWGITEVGSQQVCRYTVFGRWSIAWDEVRWIEIDRFESVVVLGGENRRLVIPGPAAWSPFGKKETMAILLAQAELRCIPVRRSMLAVFRFSRNTRMRKNSEDKS